MQAGKDLGVDLVLAVLLHGHHFGYHSWEIPLFFHERHFKADDVTMHCFFVGLTIVLCGSHLLISVVASSVTAYVYAVLLLHRTLAGT